MNFEEFLTLARQIRNNDHSGGSFAKMLQRSEVFSFLFENALLNGTLDSGSSTAEDDLTSSIDTDVPVWCLKCTTERAVVQLEPCTHLALCESCDDTRPLEEERICPLCNQVVTSASVVYF